MTCSVRPNGVDAFCISTDRDTEFNTLTDPRLKLLKRENLIYVVGKMPLVEKSMHLHKNVLYKAYCKYFGEHVSYDWK